MRDTSGAFAIMFGLVAILLWMIAGAAVDFSRAVTARTKLGQLFGLLPRQIVRRAQQLSNLRLSK